MEVTFDRKALKKAISELQLPAAGEAEWCVACGAGAASSKLEYPEEIVKQVGAQFIQPQALRELVNSMKDKGAEAAWCVACGAGAKASPLDMVSNPADISDEMIDSLSQKLISAVKVQ
jgi:predicted TPR repeat methyltransferase